MTYKLIDMYISTHSLTRRLTAILYAQVCSSFISTHSLTRRLTSLGLRSIVNESYFNSQPHKEADEKKETTTKQKEISTHSLTRRLT